MIRALVLAAALTLAAPATAQEATWTGVERIVVIGDLAGDYEKFEAQLRQAGLINKRGNWVGGEAHLVQLGDVPDRGDRSRDIMDLLMKLERQAARVGGRVHALIGNHEAMNIGDDLRYVSPGEFAAFATGRSKQVRRQYYDYVVDQLRLNPPEDGPVEIDDAFKAQWEADHPLGWVEHRLAWASSGEYGGWVAGHDSMIRINDTLFVHGGVGPTYAHDARDVINDEVRAALNGSSQEINAADILWGDDSPLWYRGFAFNPEALERGNLDRVLETHGVSRVVVGHTPIATGIVPRFGGQVILADVYERSDEEDPRSFLVIEGDALTVVHRGESVAMDLGGPDGVAAYFAGVAALDPDPDRFIGMVEANEADALAKLDAVGEAEAADAGQP